MLLDNSKSMNSFGLRMSEPIISVLLPERERTDARLMEVNVFPFPADRTCDHENSILLFPHKISKVGTKGLKDSDMEDLGYFNTSRLKSLRL